MDTDALLVSRLMAGDGDALGDIVDRFGPLLCGLARRVTANRALADDIAQEVFIELWRRPDRFDASRGTLRTFLALQAHRRAVDAVRSSASRSSREERHHVLDVALGSAGVTRSTPEDEVERLAVSAQVRQAVNQLPSEQRIIVELAYYGSRSQREIALELGIPEGTAKSRMRLAHKRLKSLIDRELLESAK